MDESIPTIGSSKSIFDYIFFLRPALHPPVWTIVILGYFRAPEHTSILLLIYLLLLSSAAASWAYIVNQISDIESDRINNKLYFLPQGIISINSAYVVAAIALLVTLIGGFLMGKTIGYLFTIGLILGYIYSGKPFYGKNHPILSTLSNGIAHGILPFLVGYIAAGGVFRTGVIYSIPYFFAVVSVFIGTTIPDIPGDSKVSKITPAVVLGIRRSAIIMTLCLVTSLVMGLEIRDLALVIVSALSMPFYIWVIIKASDRQAVMAIKTAILLLSVAASIKFWPYAPFLIVLFILTRFYYRKRFEMTYPSLT
jgi:4-hydroxybenzoate polyprenyltransferase